MILRAGTVSTNRFRGFYQNTYNIIEIKNNTVTAKLKVVGRQECPFERLPIEALSSVI